VCGVTLRSRWWGVGIAAILVVPGCADEGPGPVLPPVPPSQSPSASSSPSPTHVTPTGTAEQQILAQYRRFCTKTYPAFFAVPAEQRAALLSPVVTEMLLSELLRGARELDRQGRRSTGTPVLLSEAVTRDGANAVVFGCLDMSDVVVINTQSGEVVGTGQPS
jgi:hypothetical protein